MGKYGCAAGLIGVAIVIAFIAGLAIGLSAGDGGEQGPSEDNPMVSTLVGVGHDG